VGKTRKTALRAAQKSCFLGKQKGNAAAQKKKGNGKNEEEGFGSVFYAVHDTEPGGHRFGVGSDEGRCNRIL
jgi:hypothetical protein